VDLHKKNLARNVRASSCLLCLQQYLNKFLEPVLSLFALDFEKIFEQKRVKIYQNMRQKAFDKRNGVDLGQALSPEFCN